ncbi:MULTISPECIES: response regulator [Bradyrhizobium]|uniref:response regulator n=2 Tax=Nitrobacteraceae TaxID=41294 RepID=UPI0009B78E60|nr:MULTISPECIES: response regulator transcription factor [Bradyrhizobium]WLB89882.1 response regulator transcription factor [Bradyrhizobium japonicum USDA 135]GLR97032.1 hypothetical protein GCM10007858_46710 [Bradyrhizobium liaoningense]
MKRIVVADDHEVVRAGLRAIVEARSDWTVSGEATNGEEAIALALETLPDIVIVDYSMPMMNGLEVSRRLKSMHLRTEPLILTMHESEELLTEAVLAGVRGFLFKSDARKHLISAIEALLDGNPYFTGVRAGPGCLDSAPLDLSGFLPGYAERGALRFCRCVGRA